MMANRLFAWQQAKHSSVSNDANANGRKADSRMRRSDN